MTPFNEAIAIVAVLAILAVGWLVMLVVFKGIRDATNTFQYTIDDLGGTQEGDTRDETAPREDAEALAAPNEDEPPDEEKTF